ncbi:helix-turn-helix transcriptional regulator [bacterium]|nr:helix-turn-helix transcriptional regulator [bacterium]
MQQKNDKTLLFANTVGAIITELREDKNLSINKFAHEYDLDVGNTSRIEKGSIEVKLVTFWKLAEALEISPSKLLNLIEKRLGKEFHFYEE